MLDHKGSYEEVGWEECVHMRAGARRGQREHLIILSWNGRQL